MSDTCEVCGAPGAVDAGGIWLCLDGSCDDDPAAKEFWAVQAEREALEDRLRELDG